MTTLQQLKYKYGGQAIPEWELAKLENEKSPEAMPAEPPKRRGRPPKITVEDKAGDGDGNADRDQGA